MKARWLTSENKLDEALDRAKAAVAADPQSAPAHYALGVCTSARREVPDAMTAYSEVLRLNPRVVAAQVAAVALEPGDRQSRGRPSLCRGGEADRAGKSAAARVALARSLLGQGELGRAETEIARASARPPDSAVVHTLNGSLELRRNNLAAARTSFERALELSPGHFDAIAGLVGLDIQAKQFGAAVNRIEAELTQTARPS